jgi:hypothetical protein
LIPLKSLILSHELEGSINCNRLIITPTEECYHISMTKYC